MRKLFVVTAGTVAAGVGKEILRQVKEHPKSELMVRVRYLDTARLDQRVAVREGEWQQMHIDPVLMKALYNERSAHPLLDKMLYDGLLPKTTGVGGGQIRYNGAGSVLVNRDKLLQWLSTNIAELVRSGDSSANVGIALILSAVGATGSGSSQHLIDLIGDAAYNANIPTPIRCDMFVLQPGTDNMRDLGLANTLAFYAELASARLNRVDTDIKRYQGRTIMVGWGTNSVLSNLDQLQSTAATLVRLTNDPVSKFVAEYQEREADNHVLQELDGLTRLPTHLSSVTAVTISLGSLQQQIVQRDAAILVKNMVTGGDTTSEKVKNRFLSTVAQALAGAKAGDRYQSLVTYLASNIELDIDRPGAAEGIISSPAQMQGSDLDRYWQDDRSSIEASISDMEKKGDSLIVDVKGELLKQQEAAIRTSELSLEGICAAYQHFNKVLNDTLDFARQRVNQKSNPKHAEQMIRQLNETARKRMRSQDRASAINATIETISEHLEQYIAEKANPVVLNVLEELEYESAEQLRNLKATLERLKKQSQGGAGWTAAAERSLSLGLHHPLVIPALAVGDKNKRGGEESEVEKYYKQVSIFTASGRRRGSSSSTNQTVASQQLSDFRGKINDQQLVDLFKGDLELVLQVADEYVEQRVSEEVEKYSVLEVLLEQGEETLQARLKEASDRAAPLINFSHGFAPSCQEIWHVSAHWKDAEQQRSLERAMQEVFGQGRYSLIATEDPTEIVVFYYVDGLPMSAVQDFQGRCLDAFLQRRLEWLTQTINNEANPNQRVGVPVYSGQDAEERVIQTRVIAQLCKATGRDFIKYRSLPELS